MHRAVLLVRVSTTKRQQRTSIDRQLANLRDVAKFRGWRVVRELVDTETGFTMNRDGAVEALELVRRRGADLVAVDHIFRLGRNLKEMLEYVDVLAALGGHLYIAAEHMDTTTPGGRMIFSVFAAVGEYVLRLQREKIRAGQARARRRGRRIGRPRTIDHSKTARAHALRAGGASWSTVAAKLGGTPGAWSRRLSRDPPPRKTPARRAG